MTYSYLTCLRKIYSPLTDSHKNEQRTENDFILRYYVFSQNFNLLITHLISQKKNIHLDTNCIFSMIAQSNMSEECSFELF